MSTSYMAWKVLSEDLLCYSTLGIPDAEVAVAPAGNYQWSNI
jgi:hypothetical protein